MQEYRAMWCHQIASQINQYLCQKIDNLELIIIEKQEKSSVFLLKRQFTIKRYNGVSMSVKTLNRSSEFCHVQLYILGYLAQLCKNLKGSYPAAAVMMSKDEWKAMKKFHLNEPICHSNSKDLLSTTFKTLGITEEMLARDH